MTPRSKPRSYTPLPCMTSAQIIIQQIPDNSSVNSHSRQGGECDVHELKTSRPSQANARHFQVGCKHYIKHVYLILSNHIICFKQMIRCITVLFLTIFIILKFFQLKLLIWFNKYRQSPVPNVIRNSNSRAISMSTNP